MSAVIVASPLPKSSFSCTKRRDFFAKAFKNRPLDLGILPRKLCDDWRNKKSSERGGKANTKATRWRLRECSYIALETLDLAQDFLRSIESYSSCIRKLDPQTGADK